MDAFPAVAFWIDDGVATVGVTEQAARMAHGDDIGTASAKYSETVKACVQPRPDDEFLKICDEIRPHDAEGETLEALIKFADYSGLDRVLVTGGAETIKHSASSFHYQNLAK